MLLRTAVTVMRGRHEGLLCERRRRQCALIEHDTPGVVRAFAGRVWLPKELVERTAIRVALRLLKPRRSARHDHKRPTGSRLADACFESSPNDSLPRHVASIVPGGYGLRSVGRAGRCEVLEADRMPPRPGHRRDVCRLVRTARHHDASFDPQALHRVGLRRRARIHLHSGSRRDLPGVGFESDANGCGAGSTLNLATQIGTSALSRSARRPRPRRAGPWPQPSLHLAQVRAFDLGPWYPRAE